MLPFQTITDAVVAALKSNPDLVLDMLGAENITAYSDQYPVQRTVEEAFPSMATPSILVVHRGCRIGVEFSFPRWVHSIEVYLKAAGMESDLHTQVDGQGHTVYLSGQSGYNDIITHLINGSPSNCIPQLMELNLIQSCFPPADVQIERVSDGDRHQLYRVAFTVAEIE